MPSLRGRLFQYLLKHRQVLRLQFRKAVIDWNDMKAIQRFREEAEKGAAMFGKLPAGIEVEPVTVAGIRSEWIRPSGDSADRVILYVHGGGYVSGSCNDHRGLVAKFVKGSGISALLYAYRLAPEHLYPAALDDSVAVYQGLLDQGIPSQGVVIIGESAGGGLALALLLALRDKGIPLPAAVVAISPWTDLKCTGESYLENAGRCLSPEGSWTAFSRHYVGDNDPGLPTISPLYGDLAGLPPLLIFTGSNEILRDDAIRFANKARDAGVDVSLHIGEGLFHCYPVCAPFFPEAVQAMEEIYGFLRKHISDIGAVNIP